jgi:hypothetical protein
MKPSPTTSALSSPANTVSTGTNREAAGRTTQFDVACTDIAPGVTVATHPMAISLLVTGTDSRRPTPRVQAEAIPALWRGRFESETLREVAQTRVAEIWPSAHRDSRATIARETALADPGDPRIRALKHGLLEIGRESFAARPSGTSRCSSAPSGCHQGRGPMSASSSTEARSATIFVVPALGDTTASPRP